MENFFTRPTISCPTCHQQREPYEVFLEVQPKLISRLASKQEALQIQAQKALNDWHDWFTLHEQAKELDSIGWKIARRTEQLNKQHAKTAGNFQTTRLLSHVCFGLFVAYAALALHYRKEWKQALSVGCLSGFMLIIQTWLRSKTSGLYQRLRRLSNELNLNKLNESALQEEIGDCKREIHKIPLVTTFTAKTALNAAQMRYLRIIVENLKRIQQENDEKLQALQDSFTTTPSPPPATSK